MATYATACIQTNQREIWGVGAAQDCAGVRFRRWRIDKGYCDMRALRPTDATRRDVNQRPTPRCKGRSRIQKYGNAFEPRGSKFPLPPLRLWHERLSIAPPPRNCPTLASVGTSQGNGYRCRRRDKGSKQLAQLVRRGDTPKKLRSMLIMTKYINKSKCNNGASRVASQILFKVIKITF